MNGVAGERPAVEEGENDVEGSRIFRSITVYSESLFDEVGDGDRVRSVKVFFTYGSDRNFLALVRA